MVINCIEIQAGKVVGRKEGSVLDGYGADEIVHTITLLGGFCYWCRGGESKAAQR